VSEIELDLRVNDEPRRLAVAPLRRLLDVVRDDLGLCGTKEGCGEGECGACSVLVDGELVNSCLVAACQVQGCSVVTIEGAGHEAVQEAFLAEGGTQCGICTPGMIVATRAYLQECRRRGEPLSEVGAREALAGNLCRCTGYGMIIAAVLRAAALSPPGEPA